MHESMHERKLARAVAAAFGGSVILVCVSGPAMASSTMYNTFRTSAVTATDGWTTVLGSGQVPADVAAGNNLQPWIGTSGKGFNDTRPFNYAGQAALHWAVQLNGSGDTALISAAESTNHFADPNYTGPAEIDTGGGAWQDNSTTPTGWKHQTDLGLIRSDVAQTVTIKLATTSALQSPTFSTFGVTVFEGMDNTAYDPAVAQTKYSHHGSWNCPGCSPARNFTDSNPWYRNTSGIPIGSGMTFLTFSNNVDAVNGISFNAEADKIYTIALGGVGFSRWNTGVDNYIVGINTAPSAVPLPAAVWLLGSALAGLGVFGRRRELADGTN